MTQRFSTQAPAAVVMVRPHAFSSNPDTLQDNAFQTSSPVEAHADTAARAYAEVSTMVRKLQDAGVVVHVFEDTGQQTPDAVFPNNWFSTHAGGHVAIYPMAMPSRQRERRWDVIDLLKQTYRVQDVIDYSGLEQDQVYLEGTGAMVLDHIDRVAYVARSNRADPLALERFCTHFNFEPMLFDAADAQGRAVYHTNVLMCIGTDFALAGFDMVTDTRRRQQVRERLQENGRSLVELSDAQVGEFAGNALELQGADGRLLAISSRALRALRADQIKALENHVQLLSLDVPTIELAGGSVRCMLAGIHLKPRPVLQA
ncbi:MAG: arginine deiminase-related protein [Pseudomonadota bacterium]